MNLWKPTALLSLAGLVFSAGMQLATAAGVPGSAPDAVELGVCHDQPNMAAAAAALKEARGYLDKAEHNKGGWRTNAIAATNTAIAETDKGCAFADTH